jgi:nucleotide-binding universal stress UspA family protein
MNECSLIISSLNFLFMKRLMIATDQRQHSEDIEKAGLDLARDLCASVDIYTVIDKVADFTEPNTGRTFTRAFEEKSSQYSLHLKELKDDNPDLNITPHTLVGDATDILLKESNRLEPGMLVIGTHGRTGLGHFVMGSTAEYLVRHATVPVLVVPYTKAPH